MEIHTAIQILKKSMAEAVRNRQQLEFQNEQMRKQIEENLREIPQLEEAIKDFQFAIEKLEAKE